eukprot:CAMPEP_0179958944 /NCGR_PEP_ID=MMETSP0983-20121128/28299_1 /TAXON_ID=483367 /ORGANISM="non described non described, Strain CCMP 2436" /LENGTH=131 /DNA_ID=CAMNT_0021871105 /DNA_START=250 /DNA_END=642 /DNA_ORIENTATION=+
MKGALVGLHVVGLDLRVVDVGGLPVGIDEERAALHGGQQLAVVQTERRALDGALEHVVLDHRLKLLLAHGVERGGAQLLECGVGGHEEGVGVLGEVLLHARLDDALGEGLEGESVEVSLELQVLHEGAHHR